MRPPIYAGHRLPDGRREILRNGVPFAAEPEPTPPPGDLVPITASDVKREAAWLRAAGHTFAASLLESLWRQVEAAPPPPR